MLKLLQSKFTTVALCLLAGWLMLSAIQVASQSNQRHQEVSDAQVKADSLKKSTDNLEELTAHLNDPSFIDQEARKKLNYKLPDEHVVFVYPDAASTREPSVATTTVALANYHKWLYYILGKKSQ